MRTPAAAVTTLAACGLALSTAAPAQAGSAEGGIVLFGNRDGVIQVHVLTDLDRGDCHDAPRGTSRILNNSEALVVIMDQPCGTRAGTDVGTVMPVAFEGENDVDWPAEGRSFLLLSASRL